MVTEQELQKHFDKEYKNKRVLLSGGFFGTLIQWKTGGTKDGEVHISSFQVKVKNKLFDVERKHIIGWEL